MNALDSANNASLGMQRIGDDGVQGFTTKTKNGMLGTDLREALEVGVIPITEQDNQRVHMTMGQMQSHRESASYRITEDDRERMRRAQMEEEQRENERLSKVKSNEQRISRHFQQIHGLLQNR